MKGGIKKLSADSLMSEEVVTLTAAAGAWAGLTAAQEERLLRQPIAALLIEYLADAAYALYPAAAEVRLPVTIDLNGRDTHLHHFSSPLPVYIAGRLKGKPGVPTDAKEAAAAVLAHLATRPPSPLIGRIMASPAGHLNIYLATDYCARRAQYVLARGVLPGEPAKRQRVIVDYSSPNIAKEMHIGHLRSTIIGDTIARILEYAGHEVLRVNHVGDWGTQFGMLIAQLKDLEAGGSDISTFTIDTLTGYYKDAKKRFDADESFKERAHREVVALQAGDAKNRSLWQQMIAVSQATYNEGACAPPP